MALRDMPEHDDRPEVVALFANLKAALPKLQALLDKYNDDWEYEDRVYRFWDQWLTTGEVPHLFLIDVATHAVRDLTPESTVWFDWMDPSGKYDLNNRSDAIDRLNVQVGRTTSGDVTTGATGASVQTSTMFAERACPVVAAKAPLQISMALPVRDVGRIN